MLSTVVSVLFVCVGSFNVDIHAPIVKQGVADSYFGFSAAQHLVFNHGRGFGEPVSVFCTTFCCCFVFNH